MRNKTYYTEIRLNHKSLGDKTLFEKDLDELLTNCGYSSRTEFVRDCIRNLYDKSVAHEIEKCRCETLAKDITGLNGSYCNGKVKLEDGSLIIVVSDAYAVRIIQNIDNTNTMIQYKKDQEGWKITEQETHQRLNNNLEID